VEPRRGLLAYSTSQLVAGASSPLVGTLVDRLGPRASCCSAETLLSLGLFGSAYASALWQVVALYGVVMTVGANCLGLVVFVPLLSRWYVHRRGMAISVVQSANGFSRAVSAPVVQLMIMAIGWRHAYLARPRSWPSSWCLSPVSFAAPIRWPRP
jgi:MFS family permease